MGKPWLSRAIFVSATGVGLAACTALTGAGDLVVADDLADARADNATPTFDGMVNPIDAQADVPIVPPPIDATVVDGCSATGCSTIPAGFQLVALGLRTAACPDGFAQPTDVIEQPTLEPGACTCGCTVTASPICGFNPAAQVTVAFGPPGESCPNTAATIPAGCDTTGYNGPFGTNDRNYAGVPSGPVGGSCNGDPLQDNTKLKATELRLCQAAVVPQCEGKVCAPSVAGFAACIAAPGSVACPAEWPTQHLVGTSASFSCNDSCTCSVTATCLNTGTMRYYASANCSGTPGISFAANGTCVASTGSGATVYGSHRYDPSGPFNPRCSPGGTTTATAPTLAQTATVCCK